MLVLKYVFPIAIFLLKGDEFQTVFFSLKSVYECSYILCCINKIFDVKYESRDCLVDKIHLLY